MYEYDVETRTATIDKTSPLANGQEIFDYNLPLSQGARKVCVISLPGSYAEHALTGVKL